MRSVTPEDPVGLGLDVRVWSPRMLSFIVASSYSQIETAAAAAAFGPIELPILLAELAQLTHLSGAQVPEALFPAICSLIPCWRQSSNAAVPLPEDVHHLLGRELARPHPRRPSLSVGDLGEALFASRAGSGKRGKTNFTNGGAFITSWGAMGSANGQFSDPIGPEIDKHGNVFVADNVNARIQEFANEGTFLTTWGMAGSGNGEFIGPLGVAVDESGNVFVTDNSNGMQIFICPWPVHTRQIR